MSGTPAGSKAVSGWIVTILLAAAFVFLVMDMGLWKAALHFLFPATDQILYPGAPLSVLVAEHVELVAISSFLALAIGIPLGVFVTRESGRDFRNVTNDLTSLGQTVPPVAVLVLAVPLLGFGFKPTVFALFLYSVLPIVRNTVAGLEAVPSDIVEAARGMGMTPPQILFRVELPLAVRVIMAGIRISVVINIGTATVGAVIGAGGLGAPIIAGLVNENPSFVLEGAAAAGFLALLFDQILARIEATLTPGIANAPQKA